MLIYPAIDIRDGKCVRLRQGRFDRQTVYSNSPVDVAERYARAGFRHLHVVDLDGASTGRPVHTELIRQVASIPGLKVQAGGGIRSLGALEELQSTGVDRVILGSIAAHDPETVGEWISVYGAGRVAIAVDIADGKVAVHGWQDSAEVSPEELIERFAHAGISRFICTDISRDGMEAGPSLPLYRSLRQEFPTVELMAMGGISGMDDVRALIELGMYGAVVGTALLDRSIDTRELNEFMDTAVR